MLFMNIIMLVNVLLTWSVRSLISVLEAGVTEAISDLSVVTQLWRGNTQTQVSSPLVPWLLHFHLCLCSKCGGKATRGKDQCVVVGENLDGFLGEMSLEERGVWRAFQGRSVWWAQWTKVLGTNWLAEGLKCEDWRDTNWDRQRGARLEDEPWLQALWWPGDGVENLSWWTTESHS